MDLTIQDSLTRPICLYCLLYWSTVLAEHCCNYSGNIQLKFFARGGGDQVHLKPNFPFISPHFTYNILLSGKILGGGEVSQGGDIPGSPPLYKTLQSTNT